MRGKKFEIAKSVAKAVIDTLTSHDYVNVVCARASHWDEVGKSQSYQTEVLSCQQNRIVQATLAHRRDLKEKVSELVAGGTTELENAFELAFNLLNSNQRTACQSLIVFITDGRDSDGESVRCGEGLFYLLLTSMLPIHVMFDNI
jgi:voltage-dependent calcium channel alpha-2/delta-3